MADMCPHCFVTFTASWRFVSFGDSVFFQDDFDIYEVIAVGVNPLRFRISFVHCPSCKKVILRLFKVPVVYNFDGSSFEVPIFSDSSYIYPRAIGRPPVHHSVPSEFSADYSEACLVLSDSPKASAALSRRCLQKITRKHFKIELSALDAEIKEVIKRNLLPADLSSDLDDVRSIGNFAAHPMKSLKSGEIFDVEPGEAEWSLDIIERIFEYCFVSPFKNKGKRDSLNKKLADAGKLPLK